MSGTGAKNIVKVSSGMPIADMSEELGDRMLSLIYEYEGRMPVSAAVGCLEIVKRQIIDDAYE